MFLFFFFCTYYSNVNHDWLLARHRCYLMPSAAIPYAKLQIKNEGEKKKGRKLAAFLPVVNKIVASIPFVSMLQNAVSS